MENKIVKTKKKNFSHDTLVLNRINVSEMAIDEVWIGHYVVAVQFFLILIQMPYAIKILL